MKKLIWIAMAASIMACGQKQNQSQSSDPKAQLEALKQQQAQITDQIKKLQAQISSTDTSKKEIPKLVSVQNVQPGVFQHFIELQGKVYSEQNVNVFPEGQGGTVTSVLVTKGQNVRKGQVLATLDDATIQANIDALKNQWDLANTMYQKQQSLWQQNIGTEVQYLQAKSNKENLEKQIAIQDQMLDMTRIKSPIDGTVDEVFAKVGDVSTPSNPNNPAFRVVNLSDMKVIVDVADRYIDKINVGDEVTINFPDLNKELTRKVTAVSRVIDPSSRTFRVDIKLLPEDKDVFRPNLVADVKICDYTNKQALTVPLSVVQNSDAGKFLYLASNQGGQDRAQKVNVTSGLDYDGEMEITGGIKPGDKLIVVGFQDLTNGQLLQVDNTVAMKNE